MNEDTIVSRSAELIETEVDGEIVAMDVARGQCFGFNASASRAWSAIDTDTRVSQVIDTLVDEFDIDRKTCADEVEALLAQFASQGLVRLQPAP